MLWKRLIFQEGQIMGMRMQGAWQPGLVRFSLAS